MRQTRRTLICILLLACFVGVLPVAAQPTPPASVPTAALEALNRAVDSLEHISESNTTTVNAAVLLQGIVNLVFFVGGLLFVWRGGLKPIHDTIESDRKRAAKAEDDEERLRIRSEANETLQNEIRQKMADALLKTAEAQERMANNTETKAEAGLRTEAAVGQINTHTDAAHEATRDLIKAFEGRLDTALARLDDAYASIDKRLGSVDDTIRINLNEVRSELTTIKQDVAHVKGDTDKLNPAKVPQEPPAPNEVVKGKEPEPDIWAQDNPPNLPPETK